jgi:hypothetical protein
MAAPHAAPDATFMQQLATVLQSDEFSQLLNAHIDTRVNHITAEAAVAAEAQIQTLNVRVSDLITLFSQSQNDRSSKPATAPLSKFSGKAADLYAWSFACTQFLHNTDPKMSAFKCISTASTYLTGAQADWFHQLCIDPLDVSKVRMDGEEEEEDYM